MNRKIKWIGVLTAILLVISCFTPWIIIVSKSIIISGVDAPGTNYGRPGYLHILLSAFYILFALLPKLWAKRLNLLVTGINTAWALKNYLILTRCNGGECPAVQTGLWLVLLSSLIMLASSFFPDISLSEPGNNEG
jgi:hypothetical protein